MSLVGDCGIMFPGADSGFPVLGGGLKNVRRAERVSKNLGVFCVKNQDFLQKILFFTILVGCHPPLNPQLILVVTILVRRCY